MHTSKLEPYLTDCHAVPFLMGGLKWATVILVSLSGKEIL